MTWEYRIVHHVEMDEDIYTLAEVYFNDDGAPFGWADAIVQDTTLVGLRLELDRMYGALTKPAIHAKDINGFWEPRS